MKVLFPIAFFIFLIGCNNSPQIDKQQIISGKQWNIKLENNWGIFKITLPNHFDTLIKWTQHSDCGDLCDHIDYRVQPHQLPIFKETGFMYLPLKDSVEQFTIKHSKAIYPAKINDTVLLNFLRRKLKDEALKKLDDKYVIDTILEINSRHIPVIAFITNDSLNKTTTQYLNSVVELNGNTLALYFEYRKSYNDSSSKTFITNSLNALKSIQIINKK